MKACTAPYKHSSSKIGAFRGLLLGLALLVVIAWAEPLFSSEEKAIPSDKDSPAAATGSLYLIGGSADTCLKPLVQLAGGAKADICIIPHASWDPKGTGDELANTFTSLGVKNVSVLLPGSTTGIPRGATAIYMSGGDQNRLVRLLDAALLQQIRQFYKQGGIVAGSSAGAAAVSPTMIAGGMSDGVLRPGSLRLVSGLALLPDSVVDTHVKERSRFDRLMAAVTLLDDVYGIGLDEDTALHVTGGKAKVYGAGHVRVFQRTDKHKSDLKSRTDKGTASVSGVVVASLADGQEFDLPAISKKPAAP